MESKEGEILAKKHGLNFIETSALNAHNVKEVTILKKGLLKSIRADCILN